MARHSTIEVPMPTEFIDWQVRLRAFTADRRRGAPHAGVAPLVVVKRPGIAPGFTAHSIVCGLLPHEERLAATTEAFRSLYESGIYDGARAIYDRGLDYLRYYYRRPDDFDPTSITTLLPAESELVQALRAEPECALVFHVFEPGSEAPGAAIRTQQMACRAEIHTDGPIHDNVWWHNTLFHGFSEGHVVIRFAHHCSYDVRFGRLEQLDTSLSPERRVA